MNEDKRAFVHSLWGSVADQWTERADFLDVRGAAVTKAILDAADVRPGDRVLALADGPGGLGIATAPSAFEVVSSDVVPAMVEAARVRATERGIENFSAQVIDIEDIDQPDASFDVVVSREGLMFAVDAPRAFSEAARVLSPGGRLAAAVWGEPSANPWLSIVMDAVSETVGHPVPPAGMPGPFALSEPGLLEQLATDAGFVDVRVDQVQVPFHAPSFEAWWEHTTALAGPIANIVAGFDEATTADLITKLRERLAPYATSDGYDLPGVSVILAARKP